MNAIELQKIIESWNADWFTTSIKWKTERYVIGLTHNEDNVECEKLITQINNFSSIENINVWGWIDTKSNIKYIDISTSTKSITKAKIIWKLFNQIAIFDLVKMKEIRL